MFEEHKPIVYLVDCQSRGGGNYKDAILDFMTESDFEYFAQRMRVSMSENSMLHLLNFHSSKRLRRGTHYRLNFNILSDELRVSVKETATKSSIQAGMLKSSMTWELLFAPQKRKSKNCYRKGSPAIKRVVRYCSFLIGI